MTKKFDKHEEKAPISEEFALFARSKKILRVTEKVPSYIKKVKSEIFLKISYQSAKYMYFLCFRSVTLAEEGVQFEFILILD